MKEEFEKLALAGKIDRQHVEPLVSLTQSGFCTHRSWGFGKITTVDTVFARFTIDFLTKAGHSMDLTFAAESLKPIPPTHILARKMSDLPALRQMAALHHLDLIKLVLQSYDGKATLEQVQQVLVPDVITDDWKKWWETARREMKKDGHFILPVKKTDPIVYQAQQVSYQDRSITVFRESKGLKARISAAGEILKSFEDIADKSAAAKEIVTSLNADIATHQRTQPALALEAIFLRDDFAQAAGLPPQEGALATAAIWSQSPKLAALLEQLPTAKHRRALQSFQAVNPETWADTLLGLLNHVSTKVCGECVQMLIAEGRLDPLKTTLARLISQHNASSELLLWLAKERSDTFADILGPEVFRAMLSAIERDQFNEKRSNKLRDKILEDQDLLVELIESADIEVIKDLTRALQLSPSFEDMDKRSLLARIVKAFPIIQSLISGEQPKQESGLIVSWESLERRKTEYEELVKKKIPANSKEIAIARSYGDLRENHEYKSAKEMQKLLMRRKHELEQQLARARGTDFANPRTDVVSIGTRVRLTDLNAPHPESYLILGAWDFDAEKHIVSYLSPLAQALLNHRVGEEIEFEMDGTRKRYRIDAIEAYNAGPATPASSGGASASAASGQTAAGEPGLPEEIEASLAQAASQRVQPHV